MNNLDERGPDGASTPAAEVHVDDSMLRVLLRSQAPDFAALPIELAETGWDNYTFRLGADYAVRLPRREIGASHIEKEQAWLPRLAPRLPLPTPVPVFAGDPAGDYPWKWSVVPWLAGQAADLAEPDAGQAEPLAAFLRALHTPAPDGAPVNPVRGVPLSTRAEGVEERLRRLEQGTDLIAGPVWGIWREALEAPEAEQNLWLHGDLHARNVLVDGGALSGVIDWGDLTVGDPATDLAAVWMLLADPKARARARAAYRADEATWARARGWAVLFGAVLLDTGLADTPRHAVMGERTFRRLIEDCG